MPKIMDAKDVISGKLAECYITIEGNRYNFMQASKIEAKMEKTKTEVDILGKTGKGNKATSWKGTGSATFRYNTSILRKYLYKFKESGEDLYFDMQITNDDPASKAGRQTIILKGCNVDSGILTQFDIGTEVLDEDMDFTFEDWEMPEQFNMLKGME